MLFLSHKGSKFEHCSAVYSIVQRRGKKKSEGHKKQF